MFRDFLHPYDIADQSQTTTCHASRDGPTLTTTTLTMIMILDGNTPNRNSIQLTPQDFGISTQVIHHIITQQQAPAPLDLSMTQLQPYRKRCSLNSRFPVVQHCFTKAARIISRKKRISGIRIKLSCLLYRTMLVLLLAHPLLSTKSITISIPTPSTMSVLKPSMMSIFKITTARPSSRPPRRGMYVRNAIPHKVSGFQVISRKLPSVSYDKRVT